MSNNFWDDAVSKDGEEKTTKEKKLDLSKPISKSPKSDIVVFTNPLEIQIDFKEIQLALPNPNELTDEAIELILSSKDCWIINLAPGERFFQMDMKSNEFEYWFDGEMIHQQKGDIGQALAYLETLIPENLSDNGYLNSILPYLAEFKRLILIMMMMELLPSIQAHGEGLLLDGDLPFFGV